MNEEPEEKRRFYLYSITIGDDDMVVSIPAESEEAALKVLDKIALSPTEWVREKSVEHKMGFDRTMINGTQKKRPKEWNDCGAGPMFG